MEQSGLSRKVGSLTGKWQFLKLKTSVQSVDLETKSMPIVDGLDA